MQLAQVCSYSYNKQYILYNAPKKTNLLIIGAAFIKGYCCSYNTAYDKTATGFDCAIIPSPSKTGGTSLAIAFEGFCGGELSTIAASVIAKTVCSKSVPFNIRFLSDLYESDSEKAK